MPMRRRSHRGAPGQAAVNATLRPCDKGTPRVSSDRGPRTPQTTQLTSLVFRFILGRILRRGSWREGGFANCLTPKWI
jgi:hypothetical protein